MSLLRAAADGDSKVVELLLDNGANIEATDELGWSSLIVAACKGHSKVVELLLNKGANIEATGLHGWSSLIVAAGRGHSKVVELLLDNGANIEATGEIGCTSLFYAANAGHYAVVELLLNKGANIEAMSRDGWTSLMLAARYGHFKVAKLLLDRGANVNAANKYGWTSLIWASRYGQFEVAKLLLDRLGNIDAANKIGISSLVYAAGFSQLNLVEELLKKADIIKGLVTELQLRNPWLLGQLIQRARMPLTARSFTYSSADKLVLFTRDRRGPPLIAPPGSITGRTFLPLAFKKEGWTVGISPDDIENLGLNTLENVVGLVVDVVRTSLLEGMRWQQMSNIQLLINGDANSEKLLRCWALVVWEVVKYRGSESSTESSTESTESESNESKRDMTSHWYSSASLALIHLGPTGLLAAATMAFSWWLALGLLRLLVRLLVLPWRVFKAAWIGLQIILQVCRPIINAASIDAKDRAWRQKVVVSQPYTVSVSEVELPDASTLLNSGTIARLLSDPRVDPKLWTSPVCKAIIELRWLKYTRHVVAGMFLIRLANLVVFIVYVLNFRSSGDDTNNSALYGDNNNIGERPPLHPDNSTCAGGLGPSPVQERCMAVLAVMTAEYAVAELRQAFLLKWDWFTQPWNFFDAAQIGLMATTLGLHWGCTAFPVVRCLAAVLVLIMFWRLFGYAMVVPGLGSFVSMVLEVSLDLRLFFVFLGTVMCGFGVALQVLDVDIAAGVGSFGSASGGGGSAARVFARLYSMIFGDFDTAFMLDPAQESPRSLATMTAIICSLYMLFVTVILLNLLIAVIGDAYGRVSKDSELHLARSKASMVVESELLLPNWFMKRRDKALLKCDALLVLQNELVNSGKREPAVMSVKAQGETQVETEESIKPQDNASSLSQKAQAPDDEAEVQRGPGREVKHQAAVMQELRAAVEETAARLVGLGQMLARAEAGSGAPGMKPGTPGMKPGTPGAEPGAPGVDPAASAAEPGAPAAEPGAPAAEPGAPGVELGVPGPAAEPGAPVAEPGAPGVELGVPGPEAEPGAPGPQPGAPAAEATAEQAAPGAVRHSAVLFSNQEIEEEDAAAKSQQ